MIQDSLWIPAIIGVIGLFYILPGFFIAKLFHVPSKGFLGCILSLFTGFVVMPYIYNASFLAFGFTTRTTWITSLITLFILFLLSYGIKSFSAPIFLSKKVAIISCCLIALVMTLFLYAYPYVQDSTGHWYGVVITDTDKHFMVVTSLLTSEKFPPKVSYSHLTQETPLRYYYFYYLIVAVIIAALGYVPHIPTVFGIISGLSVGLVLFTLAALATYIWKRKTAAFFAVMIGYLSGFEIPVRIYQYFHHDSMYWASGHDDMAGIVLWLFQTGADTTPQHFFASGIFILMAAYLAFSKNKKSLLIILPLLHAISFMFSLDQFAAITLGMSVFALYVLYRMKAEAIGPIFSYGILWAIFVFPLLYIIKHAGDPVPFSSVIIFLQTPFLHSPIWGTLRTSHNIFEWFFWYIHFFIERLGALGIFGIAGIIGFRKKLIENPVLFLFFSILLTTYISIHFLKLPGPQNEYSKNGTLFIAYGLGIFSAGWLSKYVEKTKRRFTVKNMLVFLILLLSVSTALWEYHWAVFHQKTANSRDVNYETLHDSFEFIKNKTSRDSIFFTSYANWWYISNSSQRRVNLSQLSMWSVWRATTVEEYTREEPVVMQVFKTGSFDKKLWNTLYRWHTDYVYLSIYDPVYKKRAQLVDTHFFKEIYHDKAATIYMVNRESLR